MKRALATIAAVLALSSTAFAAGNYKVTVTPPTAVKKGEKAVAKVHIEGTNGFSVNTEYPMKLTVTPPAGVKVEKAAQTKADAVVLKPAGADFAIVFTSSETGRKGFAGELKFAVSTDKDMAPATEKIAFDVEVK
jgi:hypothetical protein